MASGSEDLSIPGQLRALLEQLQEEHGQRFLQLENAIAVQREEIKELRNVAAAENEKHQNEIEEQRKEIEKHQNEIKELRETVQNKTRLAEGRFYANAAGFWADEVVNFGEADFRALSRATLPENRIAEYEQTRAQCANEEAVGRQDNPSSRCSVESDARPVVDFMGKRAVYLQAAHLLPHGPTCSAWFGVMAAAIVGVPIDLSTECYMLTALVNGVTSPKRKKKKKGSKGRRPSGTTGLKHSPVNFVWTTSQFFFDNAPTLFILPLMTLDEAKEWHSGQSYDAMVVCRTWTGGEAEDAYVATGIVGEYSTCEPSEIRMATATLAQFLKRSTHSMFSKCFESQMTLLSSGNTDKNMKEKAKAILSIRKRMLKDPGVKTPTIKSGVDLSSLKVAKTNFASASNALEAEGPQRHPPPDPLLLLLKAALTHSRQAYTTPLLPGCREQSEACSQCLAQAYSSAAPSRASLSTGTASKKTFVDDYLSEVVRPG